MSRRDRMDNEELAHNADLIMVLVAIGALALWACGLL